MYSPGQQVPNEGTHLSDVKTRHSVAAQPQDPQSDGVSPRQRSGVLDWLVNDTRGERFLDNIFRDCCVKLRAQGIPIARASMHLRLQHPNGSAHGSSGVPI
jgi:hypothetical protein